MRKIAERMYVRTDTSFAFPVKTLITVKEIKARPIPCPIELETGIARSIINTGAACVISSKSIFLRPLSIKIPT